MSVKTKLSSDLQQCIADVFKMDEFYDFTVEVGNTSFQCHRVILTACSGFFQGLFRSQMKECQQNHVNIGGMTASTFDVILNTLYKGIDGLTEENVLDVWSAAVQLQIRHLIEECESFVVEHMSVDNCFSILNSANILSSRKIVDHSLDFIVKHFEQVRNTEDFLELSFSHFYDIIANDYLATSSEDVVVETVMKWVEYTPSLRQHSQVDVEITDCKETISSEEIKDIPISLQTNVNNADESGHSVSVASTNDPGGIRRCCDNCMAINTVKDNRKKHLFKLISACRLLVISSSSLENILRNHPVLMSCRKAYDLVVDAVMYKLQVKLHHDSWPEAAVHRASSSMKHVLVFLFNRKFMAYSLNDGLICEYAYLPEDFKQNVTITVFDNTLCLEYMNISGARKLSMYTQEKIWTTLIDSRLKSFTKAQSACHTSFAASETDFSQMSMLFEQSIVNGPPGKNCPNNDFKFAPGSIPTHTVFLAHGCYIYGLYRNSPQYTGLNAEYPSSSICLLQRCHCLLDQRREWVTSCKLEHGGDVLVRFQQYILVFSTENNIVTAQCRNTETKKKHIVKNAMKGTSQDMTSFSHQGNVFILQRNGSLWKIVSSDISPVDFELISTLWNQSYKLRGCIVYRKKLFVFCRTKSFNLNLSLASLPEVFESIELVNVKCDTPCLPMILPWSCLTTLDTTSV